jgi:hypothetical protein
MYPAPDFEAAEATIRATLARTDFVEAARRLERGGIGEERIRSLGPTMASSFVEAEWGPLEEACAGLEPRVLPRLFLLRLAMANLERLRRYPVVDEVKARLLDFYLYVCAPDREEETLLNPRRHGFRAMCRMALIRRFPAGQSDWEIGGFTRSWLLKARTRDIARLAWTIWGKAGGIAPYVVGHTAYRRELPIVTREGELRTSHLVAGSVEMQPEIKGVLGSSWFMDPELKFVSPHMGWISEWIDETCRGYGAFFTTIGPADPGLGYLVGDRRRRKLYETGEWKPVVGLHIWPREGFLRWHRETG